MAFTPHQREYGDHRPMRSLKTQISSQDLICIRTLYLERRYKQCISVCEDLFKPNLHPVHKVFRLFHVSVAYEALGLAAHNYSRNRIPFFESARDNFIEALDLLPQPFTANESGQSDNPQLSPGVAVFPPSIDGVLKVEFPADIQTPSIRLSTRTRTPSEASSHYSSSSTSSISETYTVPDFDRYSPRPDLLAVTKSIPRTTTFSDVQKQGQQWDETEEAEAEAEGEEEAGDLHATSLRTPQPSYQVRLSAHLSSTHVLSTNLVPSPLFGRKKKMAWIPFPDLVSTADTSTDPDQEQPLDEPPRPLPRTPYTHRAHLTLLPARRTAVQTLISKFENTLPSPNTPSSYSSASPRLALTPDIRVTKTPVTERFAAIASTFAPKASSLNGDPVPSNEIVLADYLSSHALSRFNGSLASFRTSLVSSIERIGTLIEQTHETQECHAEEKRETTIRELKASDKSTAPAFGGKRLASMWLLDNKMPSSPGPRTPRLESARPNAKNLTINTDPITFKVEALQSKKTKFRDRLASLRIQESETKKAQRISNLRACGFDVCKEKYGWKGARHYDEIRRNVEFELAV